MRISRGRFGLILKLVHSLVGGRGEGGHISRKTCG